MTQCSHSETGYPLCAFVPAFQLPAFGFLPQDLAIIAEEKAITGARSARLFLDGDDLVLEIQAEGFSKDELLQLRSHAQALENGTDVHIHGNRHCLALFASPMIIDDHEVSSLSLVFHLDPFAAAA